MSKFLNKCNEAQQKNDILTEEVENLKKNIEELESERNSGVSEKEASLLAEIESLKQ